MIGITFVLFFSSSSSSSKKIIFSHYHRKRKNNFLNILFSQLNTYSSVDKNFEIYVFYNVESATLTKMKK